MKGERLAWILAGFLAANQLWSWLAGHGDRSEVEALERRIDALEDQVIYNQNPLAQKRMQDMLRQLDRVAEQGISEEDQRSVWPRRE